MLIDSHCHLDLIDYKELGGSPDTVIKEAMDAGVEYFLSISVNLEDFPKIEQIAVPHDNVYLSVGVHPNETNGHDPSVEELIKLVEANKKIIAIGETGLDYFRSEGDLTWQKQRFINHIQAAIHTKKPLIIHTRDARDDTFNMLKEHNARDAGGIIHCFTEDWDTAKLALDLGFYISFSGIVTFKNAKQIQEAAKNIPIDKMLIETDSPYLAPTPHRGKPNFPKYVKHVAQFIAELRGESYDYIKEQTSKNFLDLFNLK